MCVILIEEFPVEIDYFYIFKQLKFCVRFYFFV